MKCGTLKFARNCYNSLQNRQLLSLSMSYTSWKYTSWKVGNILVGFDRKIISYRKQPNFCTSCHTFFKIYIIYILKFTKFTWNIYKLYFILVVKNILALLCNVITKECFMHVWRTYMKLEPIHTTISSKPKPWYNVFIPAIWKLFYLKKFMHT